MTTPKKAPPNLNYIIPQLRSLAIPIGSLNEDPSNAQIHSERNLQAIQDSILLKGQDQPIVVREEGMTVTKGHGRLTAMRRLGYEHIAAIVVNESRVSAIERGLADNRTSALSQVDDELLANLLHEINVGHGVAIGWTAAELGRLLADIEEENESVASVAAGSPESAVPTPPNIRVSTGPTSGGGLLGEAPVEKDKTTGERASANAMTCPRCGHGWNE